MNLGSRARPRFRPILVRVALVALAAMAVLVVASCPADAAPAAPMNVTLTQPDGASFIARQWGDEWNNGWEVDGRTIVQATDGTWYFAGKVADGTLVATVFRADRAAPGFLPFHLRSDHLRSPYQSALPPVRAHGPHNTGTQQVLVLLAEFDDTPGTYVPATWAGRFFTDATSVRDYYDEVSYGNLDLPPAAETNGTVDDGIVGWLNIGPTHPNTGGDLLPANQEITRDALTAADPFVDYAAFDDNMDGYISTDELHIVVIVAGCEAATGCPASVGVWGHNWWLDDIGPATLDGVTIGSLGHAGGYSQFGEIHADHQATIGAMVHEMGHDLDLPDLYDSDYSSHGVGVWSVMSLGAWNQTGAWAGDTPAYPDAFSRVYEGWQSTTEVSGTQVIGVDAATSTDADVVQLGNNPGGVDWDFNTSSGSGEYFLVENRQQTGYDVGLPGCGLLIWHIDETRSAGSDANADENRKLVDLEEADGDDDLDTAANAGDDGDPYPGSTSNTTFDDGSDPNSRFYSGSPSGVSLTGIPECATTMTATFTAPNQLVDLLVELQDHPDLVAAGATLTYTVFVHDLGPEDPTGVVLTVDLPTQVGYESDTGSCSHDGSPGGGTVTCPIDEGWGGFAQVDITTTVDPGASGLLHARATVSSNEADLDPVNNVSTTDSLVLAHEPDLRLEVFGGPEPVYRGDVFSVIGDVTNIGTEASGVTVELAFPDEVSFQGGSTSEGPCVHDGAAWGGTATCDMGTLEAAGRSTAYVLALVNPTYVGTIHIDLSVSTVDAEPNLANNSGTLTLTAITRPPAAGNDDFADATTLGPDPYTNITETSDATLEAGEPHPSCLVEMPENTVWYRFTATGEGPVTADTIGSGSDFDSTLTVYRGTSITDLTEVVCNDDIDYPDNRWSQVTFGTTPGETYYVQVGAFEIAPRGYLEFNVTGHDGGASDGFIAGIVSDAFTGSPLAGIDVVLRLVAGSPSPGLVGEVFAETTTAVDGSYVFTIEAADLGAVFDVEFSDATGFYVPDESGGVEWSLGDVTVVDAALDPVFTDIYGHWAIPDILAIYHAGISTGYGDGTFRPNNPVNRAEMSVFVIRAMGETPTVPTVDPFPDVPKTHWAAGYIERLVQLGIVSGYGDGTFRPDNGVNRAEMAVFVIRGLGESPTVPTVDPFPDVPKEHWAAGYIERLVQLGIVGGYPDGTFRPNNIVTRGEMAKVINQAFLV